MTVVINEIKGLINNFKSTRKENNLSDNWSELSFLDVWEGITRSMIAWAYDLGWDFKFEEEFTLNECTLLIVFDGICSSLSFLQITIKLN